MDTSSITKKVEHISSPIIQRLNFELVDIEFRNENGQWFLRLFIDKPGGVTLDDCRHTTEELNLLLDELDPIPASYNLEVSSPGIERPLRKRQDFERYCGEEVKISTYGVIEGQKRFVGILKSVNEEAVVVIAENKKEVNIPLKQIAKAKLYFKF